MRGCASHVYLITTRNITARLVICHLSIPSRYSIPFDIQRFIQRAVYIHALNQKSGNVKLASDMEYVDRHNGRLLRLSLGLVRAPFPH